MLFVSHNMGAIQALTNRTILLDSGRTRYFGKTQDVIREYLDSSSPRYPAEEDVEQLHRISPEYGEIVRLVRIRVGDGTTGKIPFGSDICLKIALRSRQNVGMLRFGIAVMSCSRQAILSTFSEPIVLSTPNKVHCYEITLHNSRLAPGTYQIAVSLGSDQVHQRRRDYDLLIDGPYFEILVTTEGELYLNKWDTSWGNIFHNATSIKEISDI